MPLTLVQRRALLAAMNNTQKLEKKYQKAVTNSRALIYADRRLVRAAEQKMRNASTKWQRSRALLKRLENKLGVNGHTVNYGEIEKGLVSNLLTKHLPLMKHKRWLKGLEAEKQRALANFALLSSPSAFKASPVRMPSPKRVSPVRSSPPRRRTPSPVRPDNNAHRRVHGIGPVNTTHITWSRNANGKINRSKTLENISLKLTNAQRKVIEKMPENLAINTIRRLARLPSRGRVTPMRSLTVSRRSIILT